LSSPSVAVVVPVHGRLPLTMRFLESFRRVAYRPYRIVVVDDGSPDETAAWLARCAPEVKVLSGDGSLWWTGATNRGVRWAMAQDFDFVLTVNNDAVVTPDFLGHLVETARANPRSVVGSRINYLDPPTQVWGVGGYTDWDNEHFPLQLHDYRAAEGEVLARRPSPFAVELLTGCGTLVPAACFREMGLYDGTMFPHYHADSDFTLRARRRGWRVLVDLRAVVYNDEPRTCTRKHLLLRQSPWYWRPILALHLRHCPARQRLRALSYQYGKILSDQLAAARAGGPPAPVVRLKRLVKRVLRRAG
jgi:GT2 family glycosyltransferase